MKLYDVTLSGHCHKVRLFLSLLGLDYERVPVDLQNGEQLKPAFLALNPFGQVPVLDDNGFIVRDSNAILVYLATRYDHGTWLPGDARGRARVQEWLSVSAHEITTGPCAARLARLFGKAVDYPAALAGSHALLKIMEARLAVQEWLASERPTIADIACYSYIAHAPEGGVLLDGYPSVRRWLERIRGLPGFVGMPESAGAPAA